MLRMNELNIMVNCKLTSCLRNRGSDLPTSRELRAAALHGWWRRARAAAIRWRRRTPADRRAQSRSPRHSSPRFTQQAVQVRSALPAATRPGSCEVAAVCQSTCWPPQTPGLVALTQQSPQARGPIIFTHSNRLVSQRATSVQLRRCALPVMAISCRWGKGRHHRPAPPAPPEAAGRAGRCTKRVS